LTKKSQYSAVFFENFQLINKATDKSAAFFEKKQQSPDGASKIAALLSAILQLASY